MCQAKFLILTSHKQIILPQA